MFSEPCSHFKDGIITREMVCGPSLASWVLAMKEGEGVNWTCSQSPRLTVPS